MKHVVVGFSRPKKGFAIFSWLIRLFERTEYSHVYVKFYSESLDRWLIYQASGLKVNFEGSISFDERVQTLYRYSVDIKEEDYKKVLQFAVDNAGKPYSISQIFGLAYVIVCRWFGKRVKNPFPNGDQSYVCSELVATMIPQMKEYFNEHLDTVTPSEIKQYLDDYYLCWTVL